MYHLELRQFPHNFCRFNLSESELRGLALDAWARREQFEAGERRWDPEQATLTVLEGPEIPVAELSMGRGWRSAQRRCRDVTAQLLAAYRQRPATARLAAAAEPEAAGGPGAPAGPSRAVAGALVAELLTLLGEDAEPLLRAWRLALERHPDRKPSECLALAEHLVRG